MKGYRDHNLEFIRKSKILRKKSLHINQDKFIILLFEAIICNCKYKCKQVYLYTQNFLRYSSLTYLVCFFCFDYFPLCLFHCCHMLCDFRHMHQFNSCISHYGIPLKRISKKRAWRKWLRSELLFCFSPRSTFIYS